MATSVSETKIGRLDAGSPTSQRLLICYLLAVLSSALKMAKDIRPLQTKGGRREEEEKE